MKTPHEYFLRTQLDVYVVFWAFVMNCENQEFN